MTKVIGLVGSPGKGGNTELLLDRFLAGAKAAGGQPSMIRVADLGLRGWTSDTACPEDGRYDPQDAFHAVSRELVTADVIAVASPVYFGNVPAQLKALIDLGQCRWIRKYVEEKPLPSSIGGHEIRRGLFITAGGQDRGDFEGSIHTIQSFFDVHETEYWGELLFEGIDGQGAIKDEPLALQEAYDLGFRAVAEAWE